MHSIIGHQSIFESYHNQVRLGLWMEFAQSCNISSWSSVFLVGLVEVRRNVVNINFQLGHFGFQHNIIIDCPTNSGGYDQILSWRHFPTNILKKKNQQHVWYSGVNKKTEAFIKILFFHLCWSKTLSIISTGAHQISQQRHDGSCVQFMAMPQAPSQFHLNWHLVSLWWKGIANFT